MAANLSSPSPADGRGSGRGGRLTLWLVAIVVLFTSVFGGHHKTGDSSQTSRASGAGASSTADRGDSSNTDRGASSTGDRGASSATGKDAPATADPQRPRPQPTGPSLPRSAPTRLIIPKIDVDAPFTTLTIGADGKLQPPPADDTNLVGWYSKGVAPGERGTAIIAGHLDTTTSPAVFAGLDELEPGDEFTVERADGQDADFVVDDAKTFAKNEFPSERVYGDVPRAEARLITCTGPYDHAAKDYTDNLVVFAHLV
ncbi:class F sortase [Streptomyces sp. NPDC088560]|uniref:class F sortase n=1 Tax=Streptomyces sp. NPDC088560 TaxID=3365868 RepID=UPI0038270363